MNRPKMLTSWLMAALFGAVATLGGTQIANKMTGNVTANAGIVAGVQAKHAAHVTDHQHWENRRCSDHLPEAAERGPGITVNHKAHSMKVLGAEGDAIGAIEEVAYRVHPDEVTCWTQWTEEIENTNATTGLSLLANCGFFSSSVCGSAWYVGIVGATSTFASTDTMASHAGFVECTACYTGNRIGLSMTSAASTASSLSNAASVAAFPISATTTVYGAFLTTGSAVGGTAGTLWGGATFGTARAVLNGDTLNVTCTMSLS